VRRPQSNGFIERFHRTLLDEHLRPAGRTTWYETIEEMQVALEQYLKRYNTARPHRGRGMNGRTPEEVFRSGSPKPSTSTRKEKAKAA
jgi:transposase InsO family protein